MGRTVRPVRYEVDAQLGELSRYIKALRSEDREYFDKLFADVKKHVSAVQYANPLNPIELMQWSAIIELEKKVEVLKREIDRHICRRE